MLIDKDKPFDYVQDFVLRYIEESIRTQGRLNTSQCINLKNDSHNGLVQYAAHQKQIKLFKFLLWFALKANANTKSEI